MIGLDTNVLVRYLAQDDPQQSERATHLIEQELSPSTPGFVSLVVLVELCWVLKRLYAATSTELLATTEDLLAVPQFRIEKRDLVHAAIQSVKASRSAKAGLADALIAQIAKTEGCSHTVSFDKGAVRTAGMVLLS